MNEWEWQLLEDKQPLEHLEIAGVHLRAGDRVRLRPRQRGDVLDIALAGQSATIEAIEEDYEGKAHVCVVLDEDPGRDLGMLRQPGHRFFFDPTEIEPQTGAEPRPQIAKPTILVAGIGNIFLGDDAFGVEVARRLSSRELPAAVRVTDFGIRGFDLAYALQDGYDAIILVDAYPHGQPPGTVYVVEPDLDALTSANDVEVDTHGMNPMRVLRLAASMGARPKRVLLLGCEPKSLGGEDGQMGLTAAVEAAVDEAVRRIELLVVQILQGKWPGSPDESP
jgi:hydrogenase maturation protease